MMTSKKRQEARVKIVKYFKVFPKATVKQLQENLGYSEYLIKSILKEENIKPGKEKREKKKLNKKVIEAAAATLKIELRKTPNIADLSGYLGYTEDYLRKVIRNEEVSKEVVLTNTNTVLTEEEYNKYIEKHPKATVKEIAEAFGLSIAAVYKYRRKYITNGPSVKRKTKADIDGIKEYIQKRLTEAEPNTVSLKSLSKEVNYKYGSIKRLVEELQLGYLLYKKPPARKVDKAVLMDILYKGEAEKYSDLADITGVPLTNIRRILKEDKEEVRSLFVKNKYRKIYKAVSKTKAKKYIRLETIRKKVKVRDKEQLQKVVDAYNFLNKTEKRVDTRYEAIEDFLLKHRDVTKKELQEVFIEDYSQRYLDDIAKKLGIDLLKNKYKQELIIEQEVLEMLEDGISFKDIASYFDYNINKVYRILEKRKLRGKLKVLKQKQPSMDKKELADQLGTTEKNITNLTKMLEAEAEMNESPL